MTKERIATLASKLSQPDGVIRGKEMLQLLALARWALEAREALEHYESAHYDHQGNACFHDNVASEALSKFPGKDLVR